MSVFLYGVYFSVKHKYVRFSCAYYDARCGEGCDGGGGKNKLALGMVDRDEAYRVCMGLKISRRGGLRRRTVFSSKCLNG